MNKTDKNEICTVYTCKRLHFEATGDHLCPIISSKYIIHSCTGVRTAFDCSIIVADFICLLTQYVHI